MSYVIVKANFPGTDAEQREHIYASLEKDNWKKVRDGAEPLWYASGENNASESDLINKAIRDFVNCAKPYTNPNLELQWGPTLTTFQTMA